MKNYIILLFFAIIFSCKNDNVPIVSPNGVSIANSEKELIHLIKKSPNLDDFVYKKSLGITKIDFMENPKDVYAIISYRLEDGINKRNIVLHKSLENNILNIYHCNAPSCQGCYVKGESDGEGGHIMECRGCAQDCRWEIEVSNP